MFYGLEFDPESIYDLLIFWKEFNVYSTADRHKSAKIRLKTVAYDY